MMMVVAVVWSLLHAYTGIAWLLLEEAYWSRLAPGLIRTGTSYESSDLIYSS